MESSQALSCEEEAKLHRSTKTVKGYHHFKPPSAPHTKGYDPVPPSGLNEPKISFKDKLVGEIPGAYAQAFDLSHQLDDEMESDLEMEALRDDLAAIKLSKELRLRIKALWSNGLIVKVIGRSVDFSFLHSKIMALWKPMGNIDYVDLSCEFYPIRFSVKEDYDQVLRKGPWFIGQHFLSIRPWEPNFRLDEANIASIAVWVRLPKLLIEYYNPGALKEIGKAIGNVLHIDSHTAMESSGRYTHFCVQVDIDRPLVNTILIGNFQQAVIYKGIRRLCFSCGWVGHCWEACSYTIKPAPAGNAGQGIETCGLHENVQATSTSDSQAPDTETNTTTAQSEEDVFGPWMVVTRKKHGGRNVRGSGSMSPVANSSGPRV